MEEAKNVPSAAAASEEKKPAARRRCVRKAVEKAVEAAVEQPCAPVNLDAPEYYLNRDVSWTEFDRKVLETVLDKDVPLLARVQFLAIFFNNLDEFFMVRVMNLTRQARTGLPNTAADRMPPAKQLAEIRRRVLEMLGVAEEAWINELRPGLEKAGIRFVKWDKLAADQQAALKLYFRSQIFPVLTPQAV
ncbi:MAG: RNA degradosome polyphosphate kinase, partial [Duodenibacillus sp.]|nr:RNA degradosome polyphosphate kinase [Duodenibacillus sp.]